MIGGVDPSDLNLITFNVDKIGIRLSYHISFQIIVCIFYKNIHCTLVDEGSSTCVISTSCQKALGYLAPTKSDTNLQEFNGHNFVTKGVLPKFFIELGGKIIYVNV